MFDQFIEDFKADAFVEFARSNLALEENKITGFLSSELARADRGEIPVGLSNRSVSSDFFPCHYDDSDNLAGDEPNILNAIAKSVTQVINSVEISRGTAQELNFSYNG